MTTIPFEAQAKALEPMPDGLNEREQWTYQAICELVTRYRANGVTAEQSKKEMAQIRKRYHQSQTQLEEMYREIQEFWIRTAAVADAYAKDPTPANAETLYKVASGLMKFTPEKALELLQSPGGKEKE